MPVIVLEARDLTSPLSLVRMWALLSSCLTFSLVASMDETELDTADQGRTFKIFCMFTWCLFFVLTLLVHVVNIIQFHSLIPISWKNLTVTVAALAALMTLGASVSFPWVVMRHENIRAGPVIAAVASGFTSVAYVSEAYLIRNQAQDQRGYMASLPGLLKVLQVWGGCETMVLVAEQISHWGKGADESPTVLLWVAGTCYVVCLLMSLATVVVVLGDCAGRCPVPFDRLLASFSLAGVLLYVVATVLCFARVLNRQSPARGEAWPVFMETTVVSITLLAYAVDLAFSIKLLRDRSQA